MLFYEPIKLYIWLMMYNWQQKEWPNFEFNESEFGATPLGFGLAIGAMAGVLIGLPEYEKNETITDLLVMEAIKTSEIEGAYVSRKDVRSSIIKSLGLTDQVTQVRDKRAKGVANLMVMNRKSFKQSLNERVLFKWHKMLMLGDSRVASGKWRTHQSSMQIVSGAVGKEKIHFEAPPSSCVPDEMSQFFEWFNRTAPNMPHSIPNALVRSAIAHLYFESIHPFEDGNGRIGRAIAEKALSQGVEQPILLSLSSVIEKNRDKYYRELKKAQRSNEITPWIKYFGQTVVAAQKEAEKVIGFSLKKTRFFDLHSNLNARQLKVINKMFQQGYQGYEGGMSAKKYISITKTSKATATRDLQMLLDVGVFSSSGGGRSVRYELKM